MVIQLGEGIPEMARTAVRKKQSRKARKPRTLAPKTGKAEPRESIGALWPSVARSAGVRVTEDTALTLGAVFACVRVIAESLAGLPWIVNKTRPDGGFDQVRDHDVTWILDKQANPEIPAFQFRETMVAHALTWGNAYAEIERDMVGRPLWLWLITPDRVTPYRDRNTNQIVYEVNNPTGQPTYLSPDNMYHLRGLGFDGLVGYSVIQLAARSIGAGIALDMSTTDLFANDSTPGGVIAHPGRLSEQARQNLATGWENRHKGPNNRRRVAILEEGMDWKQTGLPPEDTKLIEQRQFTPADICRWFRVPPHKIGDLSRATFSNIEHQSIEFVNDTLRPWAERLETEADIKLFGRTNRGTFQTILDLDELKRGDMAAQSSFVREMINWGIFSVNDGLRFLGRNGIGPDGDKRFMQINMTLLEKIGEDPPEPAPVPPGDDDVPPGGGDDDVPPGGMPPDEPMSMALRPVFEDACRRIMRQEANRMRAALQSSNGDFKKLLNRIETEHPLYVRDVFRPSVQALAISRGYDLGALDAALAVVVEHHIEDFKARTVLAVTEPKLIDEWEPQAGTMADELMNSLSIAARIAQ